MSEKGRPLPKFGEWDVNDPASAEGFTAIFNKARDEKKTGGKPDSPTKVDTNARHGVEPFKSQGRRITSNYNFVFLGFIQLRCGRSAFFCLNREKMVVLHVEPEPAISTKFTIEICIGVDNHEQIGNGTSPRRSCSVVSVREYFLCAVNCVGGKNQANLEWGKHVYKFSGGLPLSQINVWRCFCSLSYIYRIRVSPVSRLFVLVNTLLDCSSPCMVST